jgi:hypothetical protein
MINIEDLVDGELIDNNDLLSIHKRASVIFRNNEHEYCGREVELIVKKLILSHIQANITNIVLEEKVKLLVAMLQ